LLQLQSCDRIPGTGVKHSCLDSQTQELASQRGINRPNAVTVCFAQCFELFSNGLIEIPSEHSATTKTSPRARYR
jgi:hypothetical protein